MHNPTHGERPHQGERQVDQMRLVERALEGIVIAQAFLQDHQRLPGQPMMTRHWPTHEWPWRPLGGVEYLGVTLTGDVWGDPALMLGPTTCLNFLERKPWELELSRGQPTSTLGWQTISADDPRFKHALRISTFRHELRAAIQEWQRPALGRVGQGDRIKETLMAGVGFARSPHT